MLWIDDIVDGVIEEYGSNIYDICDALDITIIKLNSDILNNREAIYQRHSVLGEVIYLKSNLDRSYERFILAHELGHAILHVEVKEAAFNPSLVNLGKLELQANYFALKLLDINTDIEELSYFSIPELGKVLHMPESMTEAFAKIISNNK